jgi:hypothetical protein
MTERGSRELHDSTPQLATRLMDELRIASRSSALALQQAQQIQSMLGGFTVLEVNTKGTLLSTRVCMR